jgi:anti-sigma factor RsiW
MNCEYESRLSAYHDGELSPADRAEVEQHLNDCAACQAALAEVRETSALFASAAPAGLSQIGRARLHRSVDRQAERGLIRLSAALSGIAAAIMVTGSFWLKTNSPVTHPNTGGGTVVTYSDASPAEQYYLADATVRSEEW